MILDFKEYVAEVGGDFDAKELIAKGLHRRILQCNLNCSLSFSPLNTKFLKMSELYDKLNI